MDNLHIDITLEGKDAFLSALKLSARTTQKVSGYKLDGRSLVLCWSDSYAKNYVKLPYYMNIEDAAVFAYGWLIKQDYGDEPYHDGSNGKGWRIYNEQWARVGEDPYAFIAIEPAWAMYGK